MPQEYVDTRTAPYNAVVRITEQLDGEMYQGTGVMISPDEVLTAGHLTYRTGAGPVTNIKVTESTTYSGATISGTVVHNNPALVDYPYISYADTAHDYAIIHLATPITEASLMHVAAGPPVVSAHITGFPVAYGTTMISDVQTVTSFPDINTYHMTSEGGLLSPGISGGPIWTYGPSGQAYVYGVMSSSNADGNYASRFTPEEVAQINAWIAADDVVPPPVVADNPPTPTPTPPVANPVPTPITPVNTAPDPDLAFIEAQYASDATGHTASVVRLYHSALGRVPDIGGMQFWVHDLDQGYPLTVLTDGFQNAPEFIARFGGTDVSNGDFVRHIYEGVLGREPEASGYQFWTDGLNSGVSNCSQTLADISESSENKAITNAIFAPTV